ncbi:hypothetical protein AAHB37_05745 [Glutamicibacter halophytocola]|uniref:hypothetical protein n=1 Tax=Glutamicibacter halophytocola TaxID=1933880 RepID=UPI00321A58EF
MIGNLLAWDGNALFAVLKTMRNWLMAGSAAAGFAVFWWRKQDLQELAAQREEAILSGVRQFGARRSSGTRIIRNGQS